MNSTGQTCDLLVIGGGINGVGIAADAAGRGLSVLLCEQGDLGGATSSASSKLIHGGLRYLEQYHFRLVYQALAEREVLLRNAPHIIRPLRFRLPYRPHLRPAWMIRTGLYIYDHLAKRVSLPPSAQIKMDQQSPLKQDIKICFEYSDGWVDDSRLVILVAQQAQQAGAGLFPQTRCISAQNCKNHWLVRLEHGNGACTEVRTRALANATGPWVNRLSYQDLAIPQKNTLRMVKGSHIVVPRLRDQSCAYILQHTDGRVVFILPYQQDFSLIGTTDVDYTGDPARVSVSEQEVDYLLEVVNSYFCQSLARHQIMHSFSGVRPLLNDQQPDARNVSRDYRLEFTHTNQQAPLLTVFGGKITTYRRLAQAAVNKLGDCLDIGPPWTETATLPGGDFNDLAGLNQSLDQQYPGLDRVLIQRMARQYGTLSHRVLKGCRTVSELGLHFGHELYQREVDYLCEYEWASCAEDILWRRTKLGLYFNPEQQQQLEAYLS